MKRNRSLFIIRISALILVCLLHMEAYAQSSKLVPKNLRLEYLENPMGLDNPLPRFSWFLESTDKHAFAQKQTAYRILVSSTAKNLAKNIGDVWDTDWVSSNAMNQIVYAGKALASDKKYFWKVAIKDEKNKLSKWSDDAFWSVGLLNKTAWKAEWIGSEVVFDPSKNDCNIIDPWLRKSFDLSHKPQKAIIHVSSVGFHELYVNGKRVGEEVMATAVTDHTKRARYISYDIASYLKKGKNVVGIWLGTGWSIHGPYVVKDRPNTPIVLAQSAIYKSEYPSENEEPLFFLKTDATWLLKDSPNQLLGVWDSNRMGGELWNANREDPSWNQETTDESHWRQPTVYHPKLILSSQQVEGNKMMDEIRPIAIEKQADSSYRIDMGVNFAGWTELKLKGEPNQRVDILFSERAQEEMTFRLHSAFVFDQSGEGTFKNKFNYSSGRWITIKGLKEAPKLSDVRGWLVRTDFKSATTFTSSSELHNWIYTTVRWTYENLSLGGFIVDCPQRERLGYGGDAHATVETGMLNYHTAAFYTKWMEDWRDVSGTESIVGNMYDTTFARKKVMSGRIFNNGILPHTAPTYMGGGGPSWGGIVVTLPWYFYQQYGDKQILKENFQLIKDWISFLDSQTKDNLLQRFGGSWDYLGDWLWPNATAEGMNNNSPQTLCFNNSYRVYNLRIASKIAGQLGAIAEQQKWEEEADAYSKTIHEKFYNPQDTSYSDGSMGNLVAALLADVVPSNLKADVFKRLENEILHRKKGHIHVGITGGALLFKLLREQNRQDLLLAMTSQTTYPSWGYMKENDATTIWEMWEKDLPGHSLLHSSYLYPGAWYIDGIAGIKVGKPGYTEFVIEPPLLKSDDLTDAEATFESTVGLIKSKWARSPQGFSLEISVPPNSTALLKVRRDHNLTIPENPGIVEFVSDENDIQTYRLQSGNFTF
ncbi:family 78 glycoside hydrolase catalytic domain [Sphingobacterium hungaricum]|nr:family 78 glycoside hydrolase catalytic domain [Sphingobacterium hungaricum]